MFRPWSMSRSRWLVLWKVFTTLPIQVCWSSASSIQTLLLWWLLTLCTYWIAPLLSFSTHCTLKPDMLIARQLYASWRIRLAWVAAREIHGKLALLLLAVSIYSSFAAVLVTVWLYVKLRHVSLYIVFSQSFVDHLWSCVVYTLCPQKIHQV